MSLFGGQSWADLVEEEELEKLQDEVHQEQESNQSLDDSYEQQQQQHENDRDERDHQTDNKSNKNKKNKQQQQNNRGNDREYDRQKQNYNDRQDRYDRNDRFDKNDRNNYNQDKYERNDRQDRYDRNDRNQQKFNQSPNKNYKDNNNSSRPNKYVDLNLEWTHDKFLSEHGDDYKSKDRDQHSKNSNNSPRGVSNKEKRIVIESPPRENIQSPKRDLRELINEEKTKSPIQITISTKDSPNDKSGRIVQLTPNSTPQKDSSHTTPNSTPKRDLRDLINQEKAKSPHLFKQEITITAKDSPNDKTERIVQITPQKDTSNTNVSTTPTSTPKRDLRELINQEKAKSPHIFGKDQNNSNPKNNNNYSTPPQPKRNLNDLTPYSSPYPNNNNNKTPTTPPQQQNRTPNNNKNKNKNINNSTPKVIPIQSFDIDNVEDGQTIVGTCKTFEKNYERLTSAPKPELVRSLVTLETWFPKLLNKYENTKNYDYTINQLKSIRQDLIVQNIRSEFALNVYENNAKISLENQDFNEFSQCISQIKLLYEKYPLSSNQIEFIQFDLLFNLIFNEFDLFLLLKNLNVTLLENEMVKETMEIIKSTFTQNFHRFSNYYKNCNNKYSKIILERILKDKFRDQTLNTMIKSYKPSIEYSLLEKELSFSQRDDLLTYLESKSNLTLDTKNKLLITKK
ncbi:SAC3/GANP family protein [Tieghemostelium lacteum]|uniref:SAC3/GANP family protein n=1 Tax=Tieghemostelium lacteum TaxID=361077 RepID=A0A151ZS17_TIELA|nr:SAC3/GANP family protein [Tieghemostelium lacteum]|eukprot:KYQ96728.1 SAC3/GANP family protein [Tieghemostelium lacteum]